MAAIQVESTMAQHVPGTTEVVKDSNGAPVMKTRRVKETDYDSRWTFKTRDGARMTLNVTPEGDIEAWVTSPRGSACVARFNMREEYAALMGTLYEYQHGVALYADPDGHATVVGREEFHDILDEEHAALRERQARNAVEGAQPERFVPPGQPKERTYGKRAERA